MARMTRALLLTGSGVYSDPWHDFAGTSEAIAEVITGLGIDLTTSDDLEAGIASLGQPGKSVDLLVVNAGSPESNGLTPNAPDLVRQGLADFVVGGGSLLGVHAAANTLPDVEEWEDALGGRWIRGVSMHPPRDRTTIDVCTDAHPITVGLEDFEVEDERYSHLRLGEDLVVLAQHEHDGVTHPLAWARESGHFRAVYDGLGHSRESYESPGRRDFLVRSLRWLTRT